MISAMVFTLLQGRVLLFSYWLTYNILKSRKPRFQELTPPSDAMPPLTLSAEAPAFVPSGKRTACALLCCLVPCSFLPCT